MTTTKTLKTASTTKITSAISAPKCFLCAETIPVGGSVVKFPTQACSFILSYILELPDWDTKAQRDKFKNTHYCNRCLDKITRVRDIIEELEALEEDVLTHKYEIEAQLRESYEKSLERDRDLAQDPMDDLRDEIINDLKTSSVASMLTKLQENQVGRKYRPRTSNQSGPDSKRSSRENSVIDLGSSSESGEEDDDEGWEDEDVRVGVEPSTDHQQSDPVSPIVETIDEDDPLHSPQRSTPHGPFGSTCEDDEPEMIVFDDPGDGNDVEEGVEETEANLNGIPGDPGSEIGSNADLNPAKIAKVEYFEIEVDPLIIEPEEFFNGDNETNRNAEDEADSEPALDPRFFVEANHSFEESFTNEGESGAGAGTASIVGIQNAGSPLASSSSVLAESNFERVRIPPPAPKSRKQVFSHVQSTDGTSSPATKYELGVEGTSNSATKLELGMTNGFEVASTSALTALETTDPTAAALPKKIKKKKRRKRMNPKPKPKKPRLELLDPNGVPIARPHSKKVKRRRPPPPPGPPVSLTCDECGKTFANKQTKHNHIMTIHRGETRLHCTQCSYGCQLAGNMKIHVSHCHSTEKNYKCELCPSSYKGKRQLTVHMRRHTGEKPAVCSLCSKGFIDSSALKKHEKWCYQKHALSFLHSPELPSFDPDQGQQLPSFNLGQAQQLPSSFNLEQKQAQQLAAFNHFLGLDEVPQQPQLVQKQDLQQNKFESNLQN